MRLALFDLDNTLLAGDSDYEWGQFLIDRGILDRDTYEAQNRAYYDQYVAGTLDIHEYLGFALRPLAEHTPQDLLRWHAEFMRTRIVPMITTGARALIRTHLAAGDMCAIVTSTNSFVTTPIAREFGVPHLIATEPEAKQGRFTGRVAGTPCFREGKVRRVDEWLAGMSRSLRDFPESACYSDSHNDLPLLERVTRPVAVDPDEQLAAGARRRGPRPASPPHAPGLRRGDGCAPRAGEAVVSPRHHHRPAFPPGARDDGRRDHRGFDFPCRRPGNGGKGRERARIARQRLRYAGRGCAAARFHRQCAVLRPGDRRGGGFPRRPRRPEKARG